MTRDEVETIHQAVETVCEACGVQDVRRGMPRVADIEYQEGEGTRAVSSVPSRARNPTLSVASALPSRYKFRNLPRLQSSQWCELSLHRTEADAERIAHKSTSREPSRSSSFTLFPSTLSVFRAREHSAYSQLLAESMQSLPPSLPPSLKPPPCRAFVVVQYLPPSPVDRRRSFLLPALVTTTLGHGSTWIPHIRRPRHREPLLSAHAPHPILVPVSALYPAAQGPARAQGGARRELHLHRTTGIDRGGPGAGGCIEEGAREDWFIRMAWGVTSLGEGGTRLRRGELKDSGV